MSHRMRVADPRDPTGCDVLDVEYTARRERDQPDVGWRAPVEIEVDGIDDLPPAYQADIIQQIQARHAA